MRHGQASFGAADYDRLSDVGRTQAQVAGRALAARGLRDPLIAAGSLSRQQDTARIAAAHLTGGDGVIDRVDARWNEYDHVGLVAARVHSDPQVMQDSRAFQAVLDRALADWVEADDGGPDGWRTFADGAMAALDDVADACGRGRDAVVSTSGGVIAAVVAALLGGDAATVVALNRVTVNAAFTTILAGRSGLSLLTFNDHAHLQQDGGALRTYR